MGRQQHLARLALGRSAYTEDDATQPKPREATSRSAQKFTIAGDDPAQTFDARGRPVRAATEARSAELRDVQNDVLKLFGFIPAGDGGSVQVPDRAADEPASPTSTRSSAQPTAHFSGGNHLGDTLLLAAELGRDALTWWPSILFARSIAGLYPADLSLSGVVALELGSVQRDTLVGALSTLLAGAPARVLHAALSTVLAMALRECVGRTQQALQLRGSSPSRRHRLADRERERDVDVLVYDLLLLGVHAALLPLDYYAAMQQLGLAPAWPFMPSWRLFSPFNPDSVFNLPGPYPDHPPLLRLLTTPASLLLLRTAIISPHADTYYGSSDEPTRASSILPLGTPRLPMFAEPTFIRMITSLTWRIQLFRSPGATQAQPRPAFEHAANATSADAATHNRADAIDTASDRAQSASAPIDRPNRPSTPEHVEYRPLEGPSLFACFSAFHFSDSVDRFANRILRIPLDVLALRALAASAEARSTIMTVTGVAGAVSLMPNRSSSGHVGADLSKAGLALALRTAVEVSLFVGVYGAVRWIGASGFGWKASRREWINLGETGKSPEVD